jgi:hypothetical protein
VVGGGYIGEKRGGELYVRSGEKKGTRGWTSGWSGLGSGRSGGEPGKGERNPRSEKEIMGRAGAMHRIQRTMRRIENDGAEERTRRYIGGSCVMLRETQAE